MIRCVLMISAALVLMPAAIAAAQSAPTAEAEVLAVEAARIRAFAAADYATFDRIVADDLTMIHSNGELLGKADERGAMRASTPERPLPVLTLEDTRVRVVGEAAVVTGRLVETGDRVGRVNLAFTNTYVRRDGQWRLLAGQLTRVAP